MSNKNTGNVVRLQEHTAFTRRFSPASAARLLHDCRDTALERIAQTVAGTMDNIDDALFALADKANNNALQSHYFDSMREIRLKRQEIETSFKRSFIEAADALISRNSTNNTRNTTYNISDVGLSLVEHDDLEESLAIGALIDKLTAQCHSELYALNKRIGFLLDKDDLDSADNPIGPKTFCAAFKSACGVIESGVDIKIIVFKLFDRYICEGIQVLYQNTNNYLATNGVLPRIATEIKNGQIPRAGIGVQFGLNMGNAPNGSEPDFLSAFTQLMAANRPQLNESLFTGQLSAGAPTILQDLTLLQQGRWETLGAQAGAIDPAILTSGATNVVRFIKDNPIGSTLGNGDDVIIEVVALLFDYIFDNKSIPDKAKALVGRLQIPVLKVAIMDKSFFSKRHHPARQLLNSIAHATVGLHDADADQSALYKELEACIQKIQVEFDTDIGIFETVLNELETFLDKHQIQLDEHVEEAKKVIQGRERLKIAESLAEDEIERKLEGKPFPEFIKTFAMDKWKNLLIVAYLKEGQESDAWKNRLEMLDLIIWSALPKSTLKDKKKLVDMLPTLISGIENGMKLLSMEEPEQNEFLEKLASCHARAVNAEAYAAGKPPAAPVGTYVGFLTKEVEVQAAPPRAPTSPDLTAPHQVGSLKVEDITILGKQNNLNNDDTGQSQPERLLIKINPFGGVPNNELADMDQERNSALSEDEFTDIVKNLAAGIWFEFHHEEGTKTMERLSWISSMLGTYLFTNHDGLKTRELTAIELEEGLRSGRVLLADDMSFLVDRSFSTLLGELQKKIAG
jgi:Protein of unknown function (DUF1631)